MKVVIIGGGIAGLSFGIFLRRSNFDIIICEREVTTPSRGNAFLMHSEGVRILKELTYGGFTNNTFPGSIIDRFSLRRPDDSEVIFQKMEPWQCIKRREIIEYLDSFSPDHLIKYNRNFSHFEYKDGKAIAAVFLNGEKEYGDLFIGADGGLSKVREELFGPTNFTPTEVKEILGLLQDEDICDRYRGQLTKFQHRSKGLSFGFIPATNDKLVWYSQYDVRINDLKGAVNPESLKKFCKELLGEFPPIVQEIIEKETYQNSYIWNTRDFDLLPSFHKSNVVLIGDAAHLSLPFTSAGTTNALVDANTLINCMLNEEDFEQAFSKFYEIRASEIKQQIELGRNLKKDFLNPLNKTDDDLIVPLIKKQQNLVSNLGNDRIINVLYYTDPICSTCWAIQPQLRKLQLEYGEFINIEYKMGGLLPSWDKFDRRGIKTPADVAEHWEKVCQYYEMPINQNIWLEDPLPSSYPPSIAFKAAQLQDTGLAVMFLRRIREMVFLEKKNIIKKEYLYKAAFEVGLDAARLMRDLEGKAQLLFREDLILSDELEIDELPTLIFTNKEGVKYSIKGYVEYENLEEIICKLEPNLVKRTYDNSPEYLFKVFPTITTKEFAFMRSEEDAESRKILEELHTKDLITRFESFAGNMWLSNFEKLNS